MDSIVQYILNQSKLEVTLIKITNAGPNSFTMTIESRVTNTGPIGATQSPMTVDMIGPKGVFGRLNLPEVKTSSKGAQVNIPDQHIDIVDMDAYMAFVSSIQLDEKLTLRLDNGQGTITALFGKKSQVVYRKEVQMLGMNGPRTEIVSTEVTGEKSFKNKLRITNPSPLEIDLGETTFEYVGKDGKVLARQFATLYIPRGESVHDVTGEVVEKGDIAEVRLKGVDVKVESWIKKSIAYFDAPIKLTPELEGLFKA
ncbi:hypothetical protein EJ06DRAFT_560635 [Trichodelitschia bisporula]|uniref:Uncharacterized protein n=1 Tax=Trichodelitschia bisporula TaxID=703511 RepID=A0A6G1HI79_9PEZI|nr:hypothetical protein EJ06DRAFT_560635 [Trichodelitschia bisporula]